MTKYEELCSAFEGMKKSYYERKDSSLKFAKWLVTGLLSYLGCTEKQLKYVSINKGVSSNLSQYIPGSAQLDEDSCWHVGVGIRLEKPPLLPLAETAVIDIVIDRREEAFVVKLAALDDKFTIHEGMTDEAEAFHSFVFRVISNQYQTAQMSSETPETERKIGFRPYGSRAR